MNSFHQFNHDIWDSPKKEKVVARHHSDKAFKIERKITNMIDPGMIADKIAPFEHTSPLIAVRVDTIIYGRQLVTK